MSLDGAKLARPTHDGIRLARPTHDGVRLARPTHPRISAVARAAAYVSTYVRET